MKDAKLKKLKMNINTEMFVALIRYTFNLF